MVAETEAGGFGEEAFLGFVEVFVAEGEGGVVHGDEGVGAEVEKGLEGLFGVEVDVSATGSVVGADGEEGDVDVVAGADGFEAVEVGGVAGVVDGVGGSLGEEAAVVAMGVVSEAGAPVMGGGVDEGKVFVELMFVPDGEFGDGVEIEFGEDVGIAFGDDDAVAGFDLAEGGFVKVVEVGV